MLVHVGDQERVRDKHVEKNQKRWEYFSFKTALLKIGDGRRVSFERTFAVAWRRDFLFFPSVSMIGRWRKWRGSFKCSNVRKSCPAKKTTCC